MAANRYRQMGLVPASLPRQNGGVKPGATQLEKLHPDNRHVRDKTRQQLQVLRDLGFVGFLGRGRSRCV
jgi:hypothetical protein